MARSSVARRIESPAIDTDRLGKLVRLLSSDKPGEVLATIAAIKRMLEVAEMDLHDLADAVTDGFKKPERQRTPAKWTPPAPDTDFWQSMAWFCHYHRQRISATDRDFVHDALLGRGFDCGRADAVMMRRLRSIVAKIEAARGADDDQW